MTAVTAEWTRQMRAATIALTRAGESARAIAERLGVSERTVVRARRACGASLPRPTPYSDAEMEQARRLLEDGASYREVARTLGRDASYLTRLLPGYGWTRDDVAIYAGVRDQYPDLVNSLQGKATA